jgi:hypothetical protein
VDSFLTANAWLVAMAEVSLAVLLSIVCIGICVCTRKVRLARYDHDLKRDMLQRGFSAEDIRTVIEAGRPAANKSMTHRGVEEAVSA